MGDHGGAALELLFDELNISELQAYFQPVSALNSTRVVGFEALLRPSTYSGTLIAPGILFERAGRDGCLAELETEARIAALRGFSRAPAPEAVLFLNASARMLDAGELNAERLHQATRESGLEPEAIAIEIVEAAVQDPDKIVAFAGAAREYGFKLSLDGLGTDHSHVQRIITLEPDIIKVHRNIVHEIHRDRTRRSILEAIVSLAHGIGAGCLAFGLEHYEDLVACARAGADFGQGFLLGRPAPSVEQALARSEKTLVPLRDRVTKTLTDELHRTVKREQTRDQLLETMIDHLSSSEKGDFFPVIRRSLDEWNGEEADPVGVTCFATTLSGIQVTPVASAAPETPPASPVSPASLQKTEIVPGADHHSREYVYAHAIPESPAQHRTAPYLSPVSGTLCHTVSRRFTAGDDEVYLLCMNIPCTGKDASKR